MENVASSSKRSFFFKKRDLSNTKQSSNSPTDHDLSKLRAVSALANHHIHQLSDIREASNSSRTGHRTNSTATVTAGLRELPSTPVQQREESVSSSYATPVNKTVGQKASCHGLSSRATSAMSLPLHDLPERRSSISIFSQKPAPSRKPSLHELPKWRLPPVSSQGKTITPRGRSNSPVRNAINRSTQSSDALRPSPHHTIIRTTPPLDLLDKTTVKNDRVELGVHLPSPLFVGGGTVEGHVSLTVDDAVLISRKKLKPISISRLSVDILGVEEAGDGRRWAFLALGTELFDERHPPPNALIDGRSPRFNSVLGWVLKPATATIPFCINLPLNLGPPPYASRQASIRYILCPTAHIIVGDKRSIVRQCWNIQMLTVHDPEKALSSLPSPLLATDTLTVSQQPEIQSIRVTAGLHRQTWVNGSVIFVDVHIINQSSRTIKKLEVQLEKTTLWYSHAAAGTVEKSASHLRLPKRSDTETVNTMAIKKSKDWNGIAPHSSEVRTCPLEIPRGHVTISTGRFFEVRYFINVVVSISMFKSCAVQLPVTLIHINSLDILPNSLAQVAASIEAKRSRTLPLSQEEYQQYYQGQAFAAPRRQSLDQARAGDGFAGTDIGLLTQELDNSPRRFGTHTRPAASGKENNLPGRVSNASAAHHHHKHHPSCYHCHLLYNEDNEHAERPGTSASQTGPRLPRLQVSTSGLGFSESEFELPADPSPKKVMLSEHERRLINQQKELKVQRQFSQRQRRLSGAQDPRMVTEASDFQSWKNVAADSDALNLQRPPMPLQDVGTSLYNIPRRAVSVDKGKGREPLRPRSRTKPERAASVSRPVRRHQGTLSADLARGTGTSFDGSGVPAGSQRMNSDRRPPRMVL